HRRAALHLREDGRPPRLGDPRQARRLHAGRGRRGGPAPRAARKIGSQPAGKWGDLPMCARGARGYSRDGSNGATTHEIGEAMPRYMIERTFTEGLVIPVDDEGADLCRSVVKKNSEEGATWVHSYVSDDKKK